MVKKISCWCIASVIFMFSMVAWADTASQQLITLLNKLQKTQGHFVQTVYTQHGSVLQKSEGSFALNRPGKFRWDTTSPSHQLLIADGSHIWLYDKDLQQVTKQQQQKQQLHSPAFLLSGDLAQLSQDYQITQEGETFLLKPKKETFFSMLKLVFRNQQLASMTIKDNMNQETQIEFSQITNTAAAALFQFTPPKGVDVVEG